MSLSTPLNVFNVVNSSVTETSTVIRNEWARGVKVVLNVTTIGAGSLTLTVSGVDNLQSAGAKWTILASAAVIANSTNVYTIYPGAVVTANVSANDVLPYYWQVTVAGASGSSFTVSAYLVP